MSFVCFKVRNDDNVRLTLERIASEEGISANIHDKCIDTYTMDYQKNSNRIGSQTCKCHT